MNKWSQRPTHRLKVSTSLNCTFISSGEPTFQRAHKYLYSCQHRSFSQGFLKERRAMVPTPTANIFLVCWCRFEACCL